jgi:hypothetical protein
VVRALPTELGAEILAGYRFTRHLFKFEWIIGGSPATQYWTDCDQDVYYGGIPYLSRDIRFERINSSMSGIDNINIEIDDTDQSIKTIILAESIKNKPVYVYLVALGSSDPLAVTQSIEVLGLPYLLFYGFCDEAARPIGSQRFQIEVYNEMIKWKMKTPRYLCSPTCQNEFKKCADKVIGSDTQTYRCISDVVNHALNKPTTGADWDHFWVFDAAGGGVPWVEGVWHLSGTCRYVDGTFPGDDWCDKSWERCLALANTVNFDGCRWLPGIQGKEILWGRNRKKD